MTEKQERAEQVNQVIRTIADCGRRFFYTKSKDNYAYMEVDHRGRIWFVDDYNQKRIYTHYSGRWYWFSHGGTLQQLIKSFRDYIGKGEQLHPNTFGPWPEWVCEGDLWGYGADMQQVRDKAQSLGLISQ